MVEVSEERRAEVMEAYRTVGVEAIDIGKVTDDGQVCVRTPFSLLPHISMVVVFFNVVFLELSRVFSREFSGNVRDFSFPNANSATGIRSIDWWRRKFA